MRKLKMFLKAQLAFLMVAFPALADKPVLTIYTYDSFISEWGPGPAIEKNFEAICACDVNFVGLDSSLGILGRLQSGRQLFQGGYRAGAGYKCYGGCPKYRAFCRARVEIRGKYVAATN